MRQNANELKILLVSNMYPSASNPAFGSFVKDIDDILNSNFNVISIKCCIKSNRSGFINLLTKYLWLTGKVKYHTFFDKFDIVFAHYIFPTGLIALFPKILRSKPFIIMSHGSDTNIPEKFSYFRNIYRYVLKKSDAVFAVSNYTKEKLIRSAGVAADKIHVINCGVNTKIFYPKDKLQSRQKLGLPSEKKIILYAGNLVECKGVDALIKATSKLNKEDVLIYIIGEGPLREKLQGLASDIGLEQSVRFENFKPKNELSDWYNAADIFVLPSLMEAFGLVALESLACGTPVIASNVGGLPELIIDGKNGFLFEPGKDEQLAGKITSALKMDDHEIAIFSANARKMAAEHSIETQASKIFDHLSSIKTLRS